MSTNTVYQSDELNAACFVFRPVVPQKQRLHSNHLKLTNTYSLRIPIVSEQGLMTLPSDSELSPLRLFITLDYLGWLSWK